LALKTNPYDQSFKEVALSMIENDDWRALMDWADAISSQQYEEPMEHYRMHQFAALVRKYPLPETITGYTPEAVARSKFLAAEHRCKRVNERFRAIKSTGRDRHAVVIDQMKRFIKYVLRDVPNMASIYQSCDFTSGAAIGIHGNATNLARKLMSDSWTCGPAARNHAIGALCSNAQFVESILTEGAGFTTGEDFVGPEEWVDDVDDYEEQLENQVRREAACEALKKVQWVSHNKISFVPKTAMTYRSIAVEPLLNSFLQKGIDEEMRKCLLRVGLDLRDQAPNQRLAYLGSVPGAKDPYCTIDLSSASDTMAILPVLDLLPPLWGDLLMTSRSHSYVDGQSVPKKYEKIASMGNGFCFPLQTLIFASICHACAVVRDQTPDFRVYGDDIIVRRGVFEGVIEMLRFFGFLPNPRKTFSEGYFRESCGADWHTGVNVRPIYIDKPLDTWASIYALHNQSLRRETHVRHYFQEIRAHLFQVVPKILRLVSYVDPSPESPSTWEVERSLDGAFWVPHDIFLSAKSVQWNRSTQSWSWVEILTTATVDPLYVPVGVNDPFVYLIGGLRGSDSKAPFTLRYTCTSRAVVKNREERQVSVHEKESLD
jgi:hypothetical protein